MFCRYCGNPVSDGARFCRGCGAAIPARPAAPEHSAPARDTARPRTTSSRVGAPVREPKKKSRGGRIVAAVLVAALLVTGFGWPGWLRGRKSDGPAYRMDGDLMELSVNVDPATELVYQAGMSSVQSYIPKRIRLPNGYLCGRRRHGAHARQRRLHCG